MTQPSSYTTSKLSWTFLHTSIQTLQNFDTEIEDIDLNLQAPSLIILCSASIESFCNEVSSLTAAFLLNSEQHQSEYRFQKFKTDELGLCIKKLNKIKDFKTNSSGSFYERYIRLIDHIGLKKPIFYENINHLKKLRDSLVHFRSCDVKIVQGKDGVFKRHHEPPEVFQHIIGKKDYEICGYPIVDGEEHHKYMDWPLRISTNAMAIWTVKLSFNSILYILDSLPSGEYKDFIERAYSSRDDSHSSIFKEGLSKIVNLENEIFR